MTHNARHLGRRWVALNGGLAFLLSAAPLLLLLDKSDTLLAQLSIWYPLIPPLLIFVATCVLSRDVPDRVLSIAHAWIGVGVWFGVQLGFHSLSETSVVFRLLSLPFVAVGGQGFAAGAAVFLVGGITMIGWRLRAPSRAPQMLSNRQRTRAAGVALAALVLPALLVTFGSRLTDDAAVRGSLVPTEETIFTWIEDIYDLGARRPGSEADHRAIEYLKDTLRRFGFEDVREEPFAFDYWEVTGWGLTIAGREGETERLESIYANYTGPTGEEGVTGDLVHVGEGKPSDFETADVRGKVVLVDLMPIALGWDKQALFSHFAYDSEGTAKGGEHVYSWMYKVKFVKLYGEAEARGAKAIICIFKGYPKIGETFDYAGPYDGVLRRVPSLFVPEEVGDALKARLAQGPVAANVVLTAKIQRGGGRTATVYGVLPGKSDRVVVIHSHHDSLWRGATEDSSGCAMVLAQARYYSQLPQDDRDFTMIFLFTGSHFVNMGDNFAFIDRHKNVLVPRIQLDICIEHIADDYNPPNPASGNPEPRAFFATESAVLNSLLARLIAKHGLQRSLIFPTGTVLGVPTDAEHFVVAGVPTVSLISAPTYLFDADDTLERVAREELVPVTEMFIELVSQLQSKGISLTRFGLNWFVVIILIFVLTPLALVGRR